MRQPMRYNLADEHLGRIFLQEDGYLVMYSDYAALAAENERLRKDKENADGYIRSLERKIAAKEGRDAK